MNYLSIKDGHFEGKTVLVRADLNVPVLDGRITDFTRIDRVKATIDILRSQGAKILVCCHYGRPKGEIKPEYSAKFLRAALEDRWGTNTHFVDDCIGSEVEKCLSHASIGDVVLLENVRFHSGEEQNDIGFARQLGAHADAYVNDAFSASHRAHASTSAIADILPAYAGCLMSEELNSLHTALEDPEKPVLAIVGGAKVSTKLELLGNLIDKVDYLVLGGGMANTFLFAQSPNTDLGSSLCEKEMAETALGILSKAEKSGCKIILPIDGVAAVEFAAHAETVVVPSDHSVPDKRLIIDMGPKSVEAVCTLLENIKTVIWNGPVGAFELEPFDAGTNALASKVAELSSKGSLTSVAGGGDTVSALEKSNSAKDFTYISTAGGAFLEWLEGKTLPGVQALEDSARRLKCTA